MAKFRQGDLVLQATQKIIQGSTNVIDENGVALFESLQISTGPTITEFSIDGTLVGDSDSAIATEKAVKTYVDAAVVGGTTNKIIQGDSYVIVDDSTSTGSIISVVDGVEVQTVTSSGLSLGESIVTIGEFSTDGTLADDSDDAVPTEKAVKTYVDSRQILGNITDTYISIDQALNKIILVVDSTITGSLNINGLEIPQGGLKLITGTTINEFSIDGTLAGDSDTAVPTEKAVKTYVDTKTSKIVNNGDTLELYYGVTKVAETTANGITGATWG